MKPLQRVYLCGLGALGGMVADRLVASPVDSVRVIADAERIRRYQARGVRVNGRTLALDFLRPEEEAPPADLILVAVKWHQLDEAIRAMSPFVGEDTLILSLMNGIDSEDILGRAFGKDKLLYAMAVKLDATREGTDIRYSLLGTIVFGEARNDTISPRVAAVQELLQRTGIPHRVPKDMLRELWWKFMLNVGLNQASAVMRAPYGVFQRIEEARELVRMGCREVVQIAGKAGIDLAEADIEAVFPVCESLSPDNKTSMLQDVEAGRKTEVEMLAGTVMALGRRFGVPTPANTMLFDMIRTIEQTYPPA